MNNTEQKEIMPIIKGCFNLGLLSGFLYTLAIVFLGNFFTGFMSEQYSVLSGVATGLLAFIGIMLHMASSSKITEIEEKYGN